MTATATTSVIAAAREAYTAGLCTVPPLEDGTKAPIGTWKNYQRERPGKATLREWFTDQRQGLGAVTGAVSGNLEVFEFDDGPLVEAFVAAAEASGLGELVARIRAGYEEQTPGGGVHWPMFCDEIAGNTTLARRPQPGGKKKALIQTRGEGGYIVLAPSHGRVHPSGRPYRLVSGSFATIARVTPEERRALWDLARAFDECLRPEVGDPTPRPASPAQGERPGDLFNAVASWEDILTPHGWTLVFRRGGVAYWRRPGKDRGISATTNWGGYDYFYVFTSSTEFDDERGYTRFSVYATLEHGGDFKEAARVLRARGYGGQGQRFTRATLGGETVDVATPEAEVDDQGRAIDELRARVIDLERRFRQREEEWSAVGQFLGNENINPADRIIIYKLACEALSRPEDVEVEDGHRLIRIGESNRAARRRAAKEGGSGPLEAVQGYGLACATGLDAKTVSKAVKKYGPRDEQDNPDGWGIIGRRDRGGRAEDGTPRSDILVRLPADRVADVLVELRDFAPQKPRNHGGERTPCPRCGSTATKTVTSCAGCGLVIKETYHAGDDELTTDDAIDGLRAEQRPDEPRTDAPPVPPTPLTPDAPHTYPQSATGPVKVDDPAEEEPDDWDPYECNERGCTRRTLPDKRYCDWHDPDRLARFSQRPQAPPAADPTFALVADDRDVAPVLRPYQPPPVPFVVHQGASQGVSPIERTAGGRVCERCQVTELYGPASHCAVCKRILDGLPLHSHQRDPLVATGGDMAAGGGV